MFWVDILERRLHRLALADDTTTSWDMPDMIGWVIEREHSPGFIAGFASGFAYLALEPFNIVHIVDPEPDCDANRLNDAKADSHGRIWAGSMPIDAASPQGALYRFDPDHRLTQVDAGYFVANGPALSPDETWLYHTDSKRGCIYRFRLQPDGTLSDRSIFIRFEPGWGSPDGMTVDVEGGLWVAHWGGSCISRFNDDGTRSRRIELPASQITSCTFGGSELDRLFVTSAADGVENELHAGALFEVETGVRGFAPHRYRG